MVSNWFVLSILLGLAKCAGQSDNNISKEQLTGSWASCHGDGLYVELHLTESNDFAYRLDGDFLDFNVGKYIICSNTIHVAIQENDLHCEQVGVDRMELTVKSESEFESVENGETYTFKRISDKPIMGFELGTKFLEQEGYMDGFTARKESFNCPQPVFEK